LDASCRAHHDITRGVCESLPGTLFEDEEARMGWDIPYGPDGDEPDEPLGPGSDEPDEPEPDEPESHEASDERNESKGLDDQVPSGRAEDDRWDRGVALPLRSR